MNAPKNARAGQRRPSAPPPPSPPEGEREGERIAKVIARAGICSRREAERLILEGKVSVNGKVLASPALNVVPRDRIVVEGKPLPRFEPTRLWRYHKPAGLVTTAKDPEGRTTVFERLPQHMPRVVSIGRLDINTEGLLLLTNDGELARLLELPATGWTRRYRVRAWGQITQADLDKLKDGIEVEGIRYGPIEASLDKVQGSNVWLTVSLKEGKHREVKRVLGALGLSVNRLIRLSFGPFQVGDLAEGEVAQVPNRVLMDQLGAHGAKFKEKMEGAEAMPEPTPAAPAEKAKPATTKKPRAQNSGHGGKPGAGFFSHKKAGGGKPSAGPRKSGDVRQKTRSEVKAGRKPGPGKKPR